jgi:glycosyltransferase involved in cell wall biosynthesis
VSVFTLKEDGELEECIEDGVRVFRAPARLPYWPFDKKRHSTVAKLAYHLWDNYNLPATKIFETVMGKVRPDIVSSQSISGFSAGIWQSAAKMGARVVHSPRDYNVICPRSTMYRNGIPCTSQCGDCKVLSLGKKILGRYVDAVVSNSRYTETKHREAGFFPNAIWRVVPPTVDTSSFQSSRRIQDSVFTIGFAGRLSREKGVDQLVDALNHLNVDNWRCIIAGVGDDAYVDQLKARADPRISFPGWLSAAEFFSEIDVVVSPARWPEPAGRTIAEAYAYGLPIIVSHLGGMSEGVVDGRTGWIVDPESIDQLVRALRKAADPTVRANIDRAKMREILEDRSTEAAVRKYGAVFDEVLGERSKPGEHLGIS